MGVYCFLIAASNNFSSKIIASSSNTVAYSISDILNSFECT